MTTITIDRATVQQALEALEFANVNHWWGSSTIEKAITDLRAALSQQAEPVEPVAWMYTGIKQDGTEHGPHLVWKPEYMDAMSASKGAKATPLYTTPPQQAEPVAVAERERIAAQWDGCVTHQLDTFGPVDIGASIRAGELVGPAQQAEPVQEPVAWMVYTLDGKSVCVTDNPADFTDEHRVLPLYTAPPQRKPLTEEEILSVLRLAPFDPSLWHIKDEAVVGDVQRAVLAIARAVEAAHGIPKP